MQGVKPQSSSPKVYLAVEPLPAVIMQPPAVCLLTVSERMATFFV